MSEFTGSTTPDAEDDERDSLIKLNKLFNDSKTGVAPLATKEPVNSGIQWTPTIQVETGSTHSPIVAGKRSVLFLFSSDFTGTLLGVSIDPAKIPGIGYDAPAGETLGAFAFTVTAGTLTISTLA